MDETTTNKVDIKLSEVTFVVITRFAVDRAGTSLELHGR